jgi:hypothetical protein
MGIKVLGVGGADAGGSVKTESTSKMKFEIAIHDDDDRVGAVITGGDQQEMLDDPY